MNRIFARAGTRSLMAAFLLVALAGQGLAQPSGPLDFFSGYTENPPTIDGDVLTTNDEWADAFVRKVTLVDANGVDPLEVEATLMAMNDQNNLYLAIIYSGVNSGDPNNVTFYLDEGPGGGDRNEQLDANLDPALNGQGNGSTGAVTTQSLVWDGTAWVNFTTAGNMDSNFSSTGNVWSWEARIPFNTGSDEHLLVSDPGNGLTAGIELGLFVRVDLNEVGRDNYVIETTNQDFEDASTAPGWLGLQLGTPRGEITFGASPNFNGNPTIDGDLTDAAWVGTFQRDLLLTNFIDGNDNITARIFLVQDGINEDLYVGVRVDDPNPAAGDALRIYFEQDAASPATGRNIILDDNVESAIELAEDGTYREMHWDNGAGDWVDDTLAVVGQGAVTRSGGSYFFEFRVPYQAGSLEKLDVTANALLGFQIRYFDAAQADPDRQEFWWEFAVNDDQVLLDLANAVYTSIGFAQLQLGAPWAQIMHPQDGARIDGTYPIDVYVDPQTSAGIVTIDDVSFRMDGPTPTAFAPLEQAGTSEFWAEDLDTTILSDGVYDLLVRVIYEGNLFITLIVTVTVDNLGLAGEEPEIEIIAPAGGAVVSGILDIEFTVTPDTGNDLVSTEISFNGEDYIPVSTPPAASGGTGFHQWDTFGFANGSHVFRIRSTDDIGRVGHSRLRLNIVSNFVEVEITAPLGGSSVNDITTIQFEVTPITSAQIVSTEIAVDGAAFVAVSDPPAATGGAGSHELNTLDLQNGSRLVQVRATDDQGNTGFSALLLLNVNNQVEITITAPAAGSYVGGSVSLEFDYQLEVNANLPASDPVEVQVDGGGFGNFAGASLDSISAPDGAGAGSGSFTVDTSSLGDGTHSLQLQLTDDGGRTGRTEILLVLVDNTAPVISVPTIVYPFGATSAAAGDQVTISAQINDFGAGLDASSVELDSTELDGQTHPMVDDGTQGDLEAGDGVFTATVTVSVGGNGRMRITISATDEVGNTRSLSAEVVVRNRFESSGYCMIGSLARNEQRTEQPRRGRLLRIGDRHHANESSSNTTLIAAQESEPEEPVEPEAPENGDEPVEPENGDEPEAPEGGDEPEAPENGDEPEAPENGDEPEAPEGGEEPVTSTNDEEPVAPHSGDEPGFEANGDRPNSSEGFAAHRRDDFDDGDVAGDVRAPHTDHRHSDDRSVDRLPAAADVMGRSGIAMASDNFLHALVHVPALRSAFPTPAGSVHLVPGFSVSAQRFVGEDEASNSRTDVDAFYTHAWLRAEYKLFDELGLHAKLGVGYWDGDIEFILNGESVFERDTRPGLTAPVLGATYYFLALQDPDLAASFTLDLKLPFGARDDYLSSGSFDITGAFTGSWQMDPIAVHLQFGGVWINEQQAFREQADVVFDSIFFAQLAVAITVVDDIVILVQGQFNTQVLDVDVPGFSAPPASAGLGVRWLASEQAHLELASSFGLTEGSADFGINASLALIF